MPPAPAGPAPGDPRRLVRHLTVAEAAILALDGAALAVAGVWLREMMLGAVGIALVAAAGLVVAYSRWHRRQLAEIAAARRALRDDAAALRELVRPR